MNRPATTALLGVAVLALAACGTSAAGATSAATPSPGPRVRNGASGELVKITGSTLILNSTAGDITVVFSDATTFQKTSTATFADVVVGKCIVATGPKDAAGAVTASNVRLSDPSAGVCPVGGPGGGRPGSFSPPPGASPRPSPLPNQANFGFVSGLVTAKAGVSLTVQDAAGMPVSLTVPTTVAVTRSVAAAAGDLALHECINAAGSRDAGGTVTARSITISPASANGCASRRGFGGFGGGGGGGAPGAGGGPPAGAPPGD